MAKQGIDTMTPSLRFPDFRGTNGWQLKPLGSICEVQNNRRRPITSNDRVSGPYPYYGASGVVDSVTDYIFDERLLLVGEDGAKWGRFEGTAFIAEGKYWVNNHAHVLKAIEVKDSLLENYLTMLDIAPFVTGAAPPKLTLAKLKSIPIPVPPTLIEQQKIADCLTSLDEVIAAQGRKVEALRVHKRGLMQQLFPREGETRPRLRFPEYRDAPDWEMLTLGSVAEINPKRPAVEGSSMVSFVPMAVVSEAGKLCEHKARPYSEVSKGYTYFQDRDIVVAKITPCFENGKAALVDSLIGGVGAGSTEFHVVRAFEQALPEFLFFHITSDRFRRDGAAAMTGSGGQQRVPTEFLRAYEIAIPCLEEQHRIADCLFSLDTQITAESDQLTALKTHKQGLMQQLFPAPGTTSV